MTGGQRKPIRVLVVDDSRTTRDALRRELVRDNRVEVVGMAEDGIEAQTRVRELRPDVITLDLQMPHMDGLSFLAWLMRHDPRPVVVMSSLTRDHADLAVRALALGAFEVIGKPSVEQPVNVVSRKLAVAVRVAASTTRRWAGSTPEATGEPPKPTATITPAKPVTGQCEFGRRIVAIGASTGGIQSIQTVLDGLPANAPAVLVVQHLPETFTAAMAYRLDLTTRLRTREAKDRDPVVPGTALIAPGNRHMWLSRRGDGYEIRIGDGPLVHYQRPSADVLFDSVATHAGRDAVGVLLTGMGRDGAKGLLHLRHAGAATIAQDRESCVVFGMPKEAISLGAAQEVLPLDRIATGILAASGARRATPMTPIGAGASTRSTRGGCDDGTA